MTVRSKLLCSFARLSHPCVQLAQHLSSEPLLAYRWGGLFGIAAAGLRSADDVRPAAASAAYASSAGTASASSPPASTSGAPANVPPASSGSSGSAPDSASTSTAGAGHSSPADFPAADAGRRGAASGSPQTPQPPLVLQPHGAVPARYVPWVPTRLLAKRNANPRRMRFLMATLAEEAVAKARAARPLPPFGPGDVLEVTMALPEAQHKEVVYKGVCIALYNKGIASSFKLYNAFSDTGGVVQHIPLHMPDLISVRVVRSLPAHRAKLYYLTEDETSRMQFGDNSRPKPAAAATK